ncbi:hypothetical protein Tco_0723882 [Tanacetum coccineum]
MSCGNWVVNDVVHTYGFNELPCDGRGSGIVEFVDREVKSLKRSKIALVKVRWESKRGPEFTWEREDFMKTKYPELFVDRENENLMLIWDEEFSQGGDNVNNRDLRRLLCYLWKVCGLKLAIIDIMQDLGFIPSDNVVLSSTYVGKILGADQLLVILCYRSKPGFKHDSRQISFRTHLNYAPFVTITTQKPTEGDLDLLFEAMYDDFIGGQPSSALRTAPAAQAPQVLQTQTAATTTADTTLTPIIVSSQATDFQILHRVPPRGRNRFEESLAPVAWMEAIRDILAYCCTPKCALCFPMDVENCFLAWIKERHYRVKQAPRALVYVDDIILVLHTLRPDIGHATCLCCSVPGLSNGEHLKEVKRIFRYLRGTVNMAKKCEAGPQRNRLYAVVYAEAGICVYMPFAVPKSLDEDTVTD